MRYSTASTGTRFIVSRGIVAGRPAPNNQRVPEGVLHAVPVRSTAWTCCGLSSEGLSRFEDYDWETLSGDLRRCEECARAIDEDK
jgi:hypothetical protein